MKKGSIEGLKMHDMNKKRPNTGLPRNSQPSQFTNSLIRIATYTYLISQFASFASQIRNFQNLFSNKNAKNIILLAY